METNRHSQRTSIWVQQLDTGCGACVQQIYGLLAPRYAAQLRALDISLARSPRHADVVLLTGPFSEAARAPLQRVLDAVPEPRAVIAVGNCAIGGCVFRGSPHVLNDGAEALDVNVEIAGCPPSPRAILDAIVEAAQLLAAATSEADGVDPDPDGREPDARRDELSEADAAGESTRRGED